MVREIWDVGEVIGGWYFEYRFCFWRNLIQVLWQMGKFGDSGIKLFQSISIQFPART